MYNSLVQKGSNSSQPASLEPILKANNADQGAVTIALWIRLHTIY